MLVFAIPDIYFMELRYRELSVNSKLHPVIQWFIVEPFSSMLEPVRGKGCFGVDPLAETTE